MFLRNQFKGVGMFRLPLIKKQNINLDSVKLIGYDKISQNSDFSKIVHFYLDDYKFEDIYSKPDKKLVLLKKFKAVLTPDFSMYLEMPVPLQLYAAFKSRWVGAYLQSQGVKVIPTVRWADLTSFNYCFDGIEKGSIVAVSTVGTKKEKAHFMLGYNEMYSRIKPSTVICYGKPYLEMKGDLVVVDYSETNHSKSYLIKGGGSAGGGSSGNPDQFDEEFDMPDFPGWENKAPGKDYEWKGSGPVESNRGNWVNRKTGERYYYDIGHPKGIEPHWDYYNPNGWERGYRIFPDGTWMRKILEMEDNTIWKTTLIW